MGYSFQITGRTRTIEREDYETAISHLSQFNKNGGLTGSFPCDVTYEYNGFITVSGSFSISGMFVEGFVLNMVMNLIELGYSPRIVSHEYGYGQIEHPIDEFKK